MRVAVKALGDPRPAHKFAVGKNWSDPKNLTGLELINPDFRFPFEVGGHWGRGYELNGSTPDNRRNCA